MRFSHVDETGKASMVDISSKKPVKRTALASWIIYMNRETLAHIKENQMQNEYVLAAARIAGIQGAKETSRLIPLCHNI